MSETETPPVAEPVPEAPPVVETPPAAEPEAPAAPEPEAPAEPDPPADEARPWHGAANPYEGIFQWAKAEIARLEAKIGGLGI